MDSHGRSRLIGTGRGGAGRSCLLVWLLALATCASPTKTEVSVDAKMTLAPGEAIVLFPARRSGSMAASQNFVDCLENELVETAGPGTKILDSGQFQDAMFPWFESEQAPRTARDMDRLLSRSGVRERIARLDIRYLISMALATEADGFPGVLCGAGGAGAGCLGLAWEDRTSRLDAVIWDVKMGEEAGGLKASSSGRSLAFGLIVPIIFTAYTERDACEAVAAEVARSLTLDGRTGATNQ